MKTIVMSVALIAFSGGLAWVGFLLWRHLTPDPRIELNSFLSQTRLTVGPETWRELLARGERRNRWGAIGGGLGFGLGFMASVPLDEHVGGNGTMLSIVGSFVGIQFGRALSSQFGVAPADASPRISGLQPHGFSDYLRRRDIVAQWVCAGGGFAAFIAGTSALVVGTPSITPTIGWLSAILGSFMWLASAGAFALQRRLLRAPMLATGESDLVANDIALATGLRDLTVAVAIALFQTTWAVVLSFGLPWWQDGVGLLVCMGLTELAFNPRPIRPDRTPVAQRLAGVHPG